MTPSRSIPTFDDVLAAAERLNGVAHRTPVLTSSFVNAELDAQVFFKCENFQRMGAFKFRGAYNALAKLGADKLKSGVVTFSSGNHGQAVALSARLLGIPATVVMPNDAPTMKVAATRGYGADVVLYDRYKDDREAISRGIVANTGAVAVHPYDHEDVIAGQGTAAKELIDEVGPLDALFVPLGGGGLLAGTALAARALSPDCAVYGVEPLAGNDGQQSFRAGRLITIDAPQTIADGAQTKYLGELNFPIIQRNVRDIHTATDNQLLDCMRIFASRMKLVVEPTGCLGFAAAREAKASLKGQRVGVIVSGGNVDLDRFCSLLTA